MKDLMENWRKYLTEEEKDSTIVDMGDTADDETVICLSKIGCDDFGEFKEIEDIVETSTQTEENMTGQQSEENLVTAINNVVNANGPFNAKLGNLGNYTVTGAKKMGGGRPEPKADVVIETDMGDVGISMKKENFAFLENRMDERRFRKNLDNVGLTGEAQDILVRDLQSKLADITQQQSSVIKEERDQFLKIVLKENPKYTFPSPLIKDSAEYKALISSSLFGKNGVLKNSYKIKNIYLHMSDVLGENYKQFIKIVCAGGPDNPFQADGVLVSNVRDGIIDLKVVKNILGKIQTIDEVVDKYVNDPKINIKFRLRPITKVRTTYSKSNKSHYNVGTRLFDDPDLGVSWTVFAVK